MMRFTSIVSLTLFVTILIFGFQAEAQTIRLDAPTLVPRVEVSFSPRTGSFVEGSTFNVPILINTNGTEINGIEVGINFDRNKLEVIKPSSGQSIIGIWVTPPGYDNTRGTASYVGVIPDGITTSSGLIGTISFRAKTTGSAVVTFSANTKILLNDGQGTETIVDLGRADYDIISKAPEGVIIYSETHPFQNSWYNNNNPVISWERDTGVSGFSYILDNKPSTVPDNIIDTEDSSLSFEDLGDGLWYFHIKANKNGVWGTTGDFLMRIDTLPPAEFKPEISYLVAAVNLVERALVSFFTTDNLSGIDRYEVGIVDKNQSVTISPVFVQAESPFQIPLTSNNLSVVVRAIDKAGNIRDVSMAVGSPSLLNKFIEDNLIYILLFIILAGLIGLILHYLVGHHILRYLRKVRELVKKEEQEGEILENRDEHIQFGHDISLITDNDKKV